MARRELMGRLFATINSPGSGVTNQTRHEWATRILGRLHDPVTTFSDLTDEEVGLLINAAEYPPPPDDEPCGEQDCIGHDPDGWCVDESGKTWPAASYQDYLRTRAVDPEPDAVIDGSWPTRTTA